MTAPASRIRLNLERIASHGTRWLGALRGAAAAQYYVLEFPKSGGSWLSEMVADYLGMERPSHPVHPILRPAVIHAHWAFTPRLVRVAYLVRDPRDVAVSAYFRWLWELRNPPFPQSPAYFARRVPVLTRPDADDIKANLPRFLREFDAAPVGTSLRWSAHVAAWKDRPGVTLVRYEDLLSDPHAALEKLLLGLDRDHRVDAQRLEHAIDANSFARRSGRQPGVEDRSSFLRLGVAGDWRNHFTRDAGRVADELFGESLVSLGYESRRDWWMGLDA